MTTLDQRAARLRETIRQVDALQALRLVDEHDALLLDVRDGEETASGMAGGARHLPRGRLELDIHGLCDDPARPLVVMCASGLRSLFAAESLALLGYREVYSLAGGYRGWKDAGLQTVKPARLDAAARERYARQLAIPEIGEAGQLRLSAARVLLVGAGGLGSPAALYLAAAGIGTLGIVDADVVEASNLQRQVLHGEDQLGRPKVDSAAATLRRLNSSVTVRKHAVWLDPGNALDILKGYDLVLDGSDNFRTRYLVNDACVKLGITNVHGAVYRFEGCVGSFGGPGEAPCYRCLFPELPPAGMAPSCAEAGVLGVLPGVIGLLQAVEAIKLLLGLPTNLRGRLLNFDALENRLSTVEVTRRPGCLCAGPREAIELVPMADAACAP